MPDKGVAVHWTVNAPPADHAGCVALVDQIAAQHAAKGSTGHTFYNWLFCNHGQRIKGRGWDRQSGANGTSEANREYWACSWIGGPGHAPSDGALAVLAGLIVEAPGANAARPHSDFYATACPGPDLTAFARSWTGQASPRPVAPPEDDDIMLVHTLGADAYYAITESTWTQLHPTEAYVLATGGAKFTDLTPEATQVLQNKADANYHRLHAGPIASLVAWIAKLFPKKAERVGAP